MNDAPVSTYSRYKVSDTSSCLHVVILKSPFVSDAFNMLFTFPLSISRIKERLKVSGEEKSSIYDQSICQLLIIKFRSVTNVG